MLYTTVLFDILIERFLTDWGQNEVIKTEQKILAELYSLQKEWKSMTNETSTLPSPQSFVILSVPPVMCVCLFSFHESTCHIHHTETVSGRSAWPTRQIFNREWQCKFTEQVLYFFDCRWWNHASCFPVYQDLPGQLDQKVSPDRPGYGAPSGIKDSRGNLVAPRREVEAFQWKDRKEIEERLEEKVQKAGKETPGAPEVWEMWDHWGLRD